MDGGVMNPWTMCCGVWLPLYLYILVIPLCDAGIHSRDRTPPNSAAEIPCSNFPFPDHVNFDETSPDGSVIFVSNETTSTKLDWNVTSRNPRVAITLFDKRYNIILLTNVDLDLANPRDICNDLLEKFVQRISCFRGAGFEKVYKDVTFHVRPVNEHPPHVGVLPEIQISEETDSVPTFIMRLLDFFTDRDCPKEHLVLNISDYTATGIAEDVSHFFVINCSSGFLYRIKKFDYEDTYIQCNLGKGGGFLNVTADDGLHKTSKSMRVTFVDVDDSPPVFVMRGCKTTCYVCPRPSLDAVADFNQKGRIITYPGEIEALDPDTSSTNFTYNMEGGSLGRDQTLSNAGTRDLCQWFPFPDHVYFDETSAAGSIIFASNKTDSTKQEWIMSFNSRAALTFMNQTYKITLLTAMDLDVTNPSDNCIPGLEQFQQTLVCTRTGALEPVTKAVTFHVRPVNEYPPTGNAFPDIQMFEGNVTLPYYLAGLLNYFKDRDCPKFHLILSISKYWERDASQYFMVNSSTGYLFQIKHFDYEDTHIQCYLGKGGGFLNITAEDGLHKISKSLRVTFLDIDDSPPVFVISQCTSTCYTCPVSSLSAKVLDSYQGPIPSDPPSIKALDPDTPPPNTITYNMDVYPSEYKNIIQFENGRFGLLQSFANISGYNKKSDFIVTVTVQATGSNGQTSENFVFTIYVTFCPIASTSQQITEQAFLSSTKDIIITVLAVVVTLLLSFILVYAVYRVRVHKKKSENSVTSYEEVKRNNGENVYAVIQN